MLAAGLGGLAILLVLACPVSMGVMMLFMGRGMASRRKNDHGSGRDETLADLKAEHARLAAKIDALEGSGSGGASAELTRAQPMSRI